MSLRLSCAFSQNELNNLKIPERHEQLILVTAASWNQSTGMLRLLERTTSGWEVYLDSIPVVLGKNGMASGLGLHRDFVTNHKKEGDGKSTAGIFLLGRMFGYGEPPDAVDKRYYQKLTDRDYFVDDPNSLQYNRWVTIPETEENNPKVRWNSFERMRRKDHLYELGIVIKHNSGPVVKGKGSAIFFHIWRSQASPTL